MPLSARALEPLLALGLVAGIGPHRLALLISRFGSAERAMEASARELSGLRGLGPGLVQRVRGAAAGPARDRAARAVEALDRIGAVALTPDDRAFPDAFRLLSDAPYLLFAIGDLALLEGRGVGVVGTRSPTEYGRSAAAGLSEGLSAAGFTIVSGMARGIDTVAHRAALDSGGPTIGVLGHGIDQVYPPQNRGLFARMRAEGLLITEFVPGEKPLAGNFPRRNRLIAALSEAVLVVEMGVKSGAQHTVGFALDLGRDVLAVPGPIGAATSLGTNQLIREGARMVTSIREVLEELDGVSSTPRAAAPPAPAQSALPLRTPEEATVLEALGAGRRLHVDELAQGVALPTGRILPLLLEMELKGMVESLPGKLYRRA